jgi:hypothetical protein
MAEAGGGVKRRMETSENYDSTKNSKSIVVIGTTHEFQGVLDLETCLAKNLVAFARSDKPTVLLEEWRSNGDKTVGMLVAKSLGVDWQLVDTPGLRNYSPCPLWVNGECLSHYPYGPIDVQMKRENLMVAAVINSLSDHDRAIFVCGVAHLHSVMEKLHLRGYEVEGFSCLEPTDAKDSSLQQ